MDCRSHSLFEERYGNPWEFAKKCWKFAEKDGVTNVIFTFEVLIDGKKYTVKGSRSFRDIHVIPEEGSNDQDLVVIAVENSVNFFKGLHLPDDDLVRLHLIVLLGLEGDLVV